MSNLDGKNIVLGVSGSIASYKAVDLASKLVQMNAWVDVIMTSGSARVRHAADIRGDNPSPSRDQYVRAAV